MDRRTGLAIGICFAFFILWFWVIVPWLGLMPKPPPRRPAPAPAAAGKAESAAPAAEQPRPGSTGPAKDKLPECSNPTTVPFQTERFRGEFTDCGGGIHRLVLRFPDGKGEVPLLEPLESDRCHFALRLVGGPQGLEKAAWKIHHHVPNESIEFRYALPEGVEIGKKFVLDPARGLLAVTVELANTNPRGEGEAAPPERKFRLELLAFNGIVPDGAYRHEQYTSGVVYREGRPEYRTIANVEKGEAKRAQAEGVKEGDEKKAAALRAAEEYLGSFGPGLQWMALKNRFFAAVLAPASDSTRGHVEGFLFDLASKEAQERGGRLKNLNAVARTGPIVVKAGSPVVMEFRSWVGPLQAAPLREAPPGASELLNYATGCGMGCGPIGTVLFAPVIAVVQLVAPVILALLNFLGRDVFGNYGVGIMVTTVLIRACLFPLSRKSQETAFRMQKLQPQIELLRKRYGDDRQKMSLEQWKLFREHKIHPASGCLPMFLQLPIFVGMYSVFELSVELRRAPFLLWIRDLSQPDALVRFSGPVDIPLIPTFDSFNILPILMTVTWFLQSWFAPRSPDPQMQTQQKMMMAMPVLFGIMCYNLASGLSLYFLVNSLLGMAEQKIIKKFILRPSEGPSRP